MVRVRGRLKWLIGSTREPMRQHEIERVKFREFIPLVLKNSVDGKSSKGVDVTCLQEMAIMFACLKTNDFKESKCPTEIETFNKCYQNHTAKKKAEKQRRDSGEIVISKNSRDLTSEQLNQLLQKYPQFNKKL